MADAINLREIRVQYLALDDSPVKLRDIRTQLLADGVEPASIRRIRGTVLTIAKDPLSLRAARMQFVEDDQKPAVIRRIRGTVLVIAKNPVNIRTFRLQFAEAADIPASIRRLTTKVMIRERGPVSVASVRMQYLEIDNSHPDLTLPAWPALLNVINLQNGWNFTTAHLIPSEPPVTNTDPRFWNSKIQITATPASGFSGSMDIYFQRFDIGIPFGERSHPFLNLTGKTSTKDVLAEFNDWFSLSLTLDDVEDLPIEGNKVTFRVKEGSWYYLPGSEYRFFNIPDLATQYPNTKLNGFLLPAQPGYITAKPGDPSGIYQMVADDYTLFDVYVNMDFDGGGWVQVVDWNGASTDQALVVTFDEALVKDRPIAGSSVDASRPSIPAGKISQNWATKWAFTSEHPTWKQYFGDWQVADTFDPALGYVPLGGFQVKTSIGPKTMYGKQAGWNANTPFSYGIGLWTHGNNSGPCGGANVVGPNRCCPVYDNGGTSSHADYTYKKRAYLRARNFIY
ncbi:hypothetical protein D3C76_25990 [compost metagenome]